MKVVDTGLSQPFGKSVRAPAVVVSRLENGRANRAVRVKASDIDVGATTQPVRRGREATGECNSDRQAVHVLAFLEARGGDHSVCLFTGLLGKAKLALVLLAHVA